MQTKKITRTMIAVLMAVLMSVLGASGHLDNIHTVSTQEQMTVNAVDHSTATGPERRATRKGNETYKKKVKKHERNKGLARKRYARKKAEFISHKDSETLAKLRQKSNGLASSLRKKNAKRLGIPAPEEQLESLARMAKNGQLKNWVIKVNAEIAHALSVPYRVDYLFQCFVEYGAKSRTLRNAPNISVKDAMDSVRSTDTFAHLEVEKLPFAKWQGTLLGKEQTKIQNQFVAQAEDTSWKQHHAEEMSLLKARVEDVEDEFHTAFATNHSGVTYDSKERVYRLIKRYNRTDSEFYGDSDSHQFWPQWPDKVVEWQEQPEMQLHLSVIHASTADLLDVQAKAQAKAEQFKKSTDKSLVEDLMNLMKEKSANARKKREEAVSSIVKLVTEYFTIELTTKDEWMKKYKKTVMQEFRDEYTPRAWKASMGEIVWNFHSGFNLYYARPIKVKPMTEDPNGKTITWNIPIDDEGFATVLDTNGYLYTVDDPTVRVKRSKPNKATTTINLHLDKGKEYLHQFKPTKGKKARKAYFAHVEQSGHNRVCPSHFSGLLGFMGPSNGAFVNLGKNSKHGKHFVRGDSYSYSRMITKKIPTADVPAYLKIDRGLSSEKSHIGIKLRGWWMQATSKTDVPVVKKKAGERKLSKARPRSKRGINKQNPTDKTRVNPLDEVVAPQGNETLGSYIPFDHRPSKEETTVEEVVRTVVLGTDEYVEDTLRHLDVTNSVEHKERPPTVERKGKTIKPVRKARNDVEQLKNTPATIDEELQPTQHTEESLGKLTVPELKELLKAADLKVSGKKADLIERLLA